MVEWKFNSASEMDAHHLRRDLVKYMRERGTGDFDAAELVVGELIGNAVRYAPGCVTVRVDWADDGIDVTVHDVGASFVPNINPPKDPLAEGGRGLFIVATLASKFRVDDIAGDGSAVTARLPVYRN